MTADPTGWPDTDDAPPDVVLAAVARCAAAWVPEARIIGNVRAGDILRAVTEVAAREQEAYKDGWADREDDLIAGHARIGTLDAALAQARRETWKAVNEAAEDVFLLIPPKDMSLIEADAFQRGYGVAKNAIIAAIRAKAQETTT